MEVVEWRRFVTTNLCRICGERITRHDPWVDCDGWAEHQTCHDPDGEESDHA